MELSPNTPKMPEKPHKPGRRDLLRLGCLVPLGLGWPQLGLSRLGATEGATAKSCILIWLDGGPSHLETWDPKPDAPQDVKGPFAARKTSVPGIHVCELFQHSAPLARHLAIVRSMTSPLGEHQLANHYLLTGYKPTPVLDYPSLGSVVAKTRAGERPLPDYVCIPKAVSHIGPGFLGSRFAPFVTEGDPSRPHFQVEDLAISPQVGEEGIHRRKAYLKTLDSFQREWEKRPESETGPFDRAFRLVSSPEAKQAFDLSREKESTRARYGPKPLGQSCLLARRLVERGVPFVTVTQTGWDTHESLVLNLKEGYSGAKVGVGLIPTLDQALGALVEDLDQRGLLSQTLVMVMGEFGRTPKLNTRAGRDHWPRVFSMVLAGGGVKGGQVIGSSDRVGESPKDTPVTPGDLAHTVYRLLGIPPQTELQTPDGRPVPINQGGKFIPGLV